MAADSDSVSSPEVVTRYPGNMYITLSTRTSRVHIRGLDDYEGVPIELVLYYSYEMDSEAPHWKPLRDASGRAPVRDGQAEFFFLFGPKPPARQLGPETINILLPRAAAPVSAEEIPPLPRLSYAVKAGDRWILDGRIRLWPTWDKMIRDVARPPFTSTLSVGMREFTLSSRIFSFLKTRWQQMLAPVAFRKGDDGEEIEDRQLLDAFGEDLFLELLRLTQTSDVASGSWASKVGHIGPKEIPELVSRGAFEGTDKFVGLLAAFEGLLDLVGRSIVVRELFMLGYVGVVSSFDTLEFELPRVKEETVVFFFRLPRSVVGEPALVVELYRLVPDEKPVPLRPTPYMTASQLAKRGGNPLLTATTLSDSVHIDELARLNWSRMLYPERTATNQIVLRKQPRPFRIPAGDFVDDRWWESVGLLR